ncbi:MAG: hypothetical protein ACYDH6_00885 [Acidimicrobiales bacterium]
MLIGLTTADDALIVAMGSFLVAFASLSWQVYAATHVDAPKLKVEIGPPYIISDLSQPVESAFDIIVTNAGRRPTILHRVEMRAGRPRRRLHRLVPERWRPGPPIGLPASFFIEDRSDEVGPLDVGASITRVFRSAGLDVGSSFYHHVFARAEASTDSANSRVLDVHVTAKRLMKARKGLDQVTRGLDRARRRAGK